MSKKSFVLYNDLREIVDLMPDDMAGKLFKMMLAYVNGDSVETDDITLRVAFKPIQLQLERDAGKYATYLQKQRDNGKRGGRPKKAEESQKTQPFLEKPKKADNDNVTVTVNGTNQKKGGKPPKEKVDDIPYDEVVSMFNATCTTLEPVSVLTEPRKANIRARWNDGYRLEDFKKVFTNCDKSDHHSGRGGQWIADFNWLLKPTNFDKMLLRKKVEPPKKFPFTLPQDEYGYNGNIYPELRGQKFYVENWDEGRVFDEQGNELVKIWCLGDMDYGPRLSCSTK